MTVVEHRRNYNKLLAADRERLLGDIETDISEQFITTYTGDNYD